MAMASSLSAVLLLLLPLLCQSIRLNIHIPVPDGCLKTQALLANVMLRMASRRTADGSTDLLPPSEEIDFFSLHTPHITLYLADFDLEVSDASVQDDTGAIPLNNTKVAAFLDEISSIDFTDVVSAMDCALSSYSMDAANNSYVISGAYTMLNIPKTPCLRTISNKVLFAMKSYLRQPTVVPDWVTALPEPARSESIHRCEEYGSPNVLEGFDPHVTVGYDPPTTFSSTSLQHVRSSLRSQSTESDDGDIYQWRTDAMKKWNDLYQQAASSDDCVNDAFGIALGVVGVGGTVLTDSIMGNWNISQGLNVMPE